MGNCIKSLAGTKLRKAVNGASRESSPGLNNSAIPSSLQSQNSSQSRDQTVELDSGLADDSTDIVAIQTVGIEASCSLGPNLGIVSQISNSPQLQNSLNSSDQSLDVRIVEGASSLHNRVDDSLQLPSEFGDRSSVLVDPLHVAARPSRKEKRKKRRGAPAVDASGEDALPRSVEGPAKKEPRPLPNYFVCVRITSPQVHEALCAVQERIMEECPLARPALVALPTLHITFLVLRLDDEDQLTRARLALEDTKEEILGKFPSFFFGEKSDEEERRPSEARRAKGLPFFSLKGLSTFRQGVLFAKVDQGREELRRLNELLVDAFARRGLTPTDSRDFQPHVTLLKLSKGNKLRKRGIKRIERRWFSADEEAFFGDQIVEGLKLCSMTKLKDSLSEFYHVESEVTFVDDSFLVLPGRDFHLKDPKKRAS